MKEGLKTLIVSHESNIFLEFYALQQIDLVNT